MAHYDTCDLHRRQQTGDVGHAILGSQAKSSKKGAVLVAGVTAGCANEQVHLRRRGSTWLGRNRANRVS